MRIIFTLVVLCSLMAAQAQEVLLPRGASSVLMEAWKQRRLQMQTLKQQSVTAQFLPFYDDFSTGGPYPDPNKWENSTSVFVNHTKATAPITIGVATFDGLMANGYPYHIANSSGGYPSDTLTSIPLRLDSSSNGVAIIPSDSVHLRFYWQAKGMWEAPESTDDITLEFYSPVDSTSTSSGYSHWFPSGWSHSGYSPASNDTLFHRAMILINDTKFLQNGFRFRFRNNSTGCGDVDHWHIDGVFLDKNLSPSKDTMVQEVAFVRDLETILKTYSQMPFNQFTGANDMKTDLSEYYKLRNNFTTPMTVTTYYEIRDNAGAMVKQNTNGTNNVTDFGTAGYCSDPALINPSLGGFVYNNGTPFTDSTSYLLKFYASQNSDNYHTNDTIYCRQHFENYFAYDDGTAEAGYGIGQPVSGSSTAVGAFTAVRYRLNVPDTLRAIDIDFDPVIGVNQLQSDGIRLYVWNDNGGQPGTVLHIDSLCFPHPIFTQDGFDRFQRYQLSATVVFNTAATFYIGIWQQLGYPLNIGYDLNTDHHLEILYRTPNNTLGNTGWNVANLRGSLMMRPVFGDSSRAVGVKSFELPKEKVVLYPNPASNIVLANAASGVSKIVVCDVLGNILLEENSSSVNTSSLPNGMYLVKTVTGKGRSEVQKLFIAR